MGVEQIYALTIFQSSYSFAFRITFCTHHHRYLAVVSDHSEIYVACYDTIAGKSDIYFNRVRSAVQGERDIAICHRVFVSSFAEAGKQGS